MLLATIAAAVACGIIGVGTGYFYRMKIAEGKIGKAEVEAERIITTARQNAESRKKELVLEGKEEIHKMRRLYGKLLADGGRHEPDRTAGLIRTTELQSKRWTLF